MKKTLIKLTVLMIVLMFTQSCQKSTSELENELVLMVDGTESKVQFPSFSEIKPFINPSELYNGACFKTIVISDIDFDLSFRKCLDYKNYDSDITDEDRYSQNKKYLRDAETAYNDLISNIQYAEGKSHSIIYSVVASELNKLSKSSAKNKTIIIYSDLFENSDLLNVYSPKGKHLLANPEKIERLFTDYLPLPDLTGIQVFLIFTPKDFEENQKYRKMATVYSNILTKAGCEVFVSGGLTP